MRAEKIVEYEAEVKEIVCKVTEVYDKEFFVKLKTMDPKAHQMEKLLGTWIKIKCQFLRKP